MSFWKSILGYTLSTTNYGVTNMNNLYNFIISVMDTMDEKQKEELLDKLIIHLGRNFYKEFRKYVITKIPKSDHLNAINRIV